MERDLVYVILGDSFDVGSSWSLERLIKRADRRGDEIFKLWTKDGSTAYEWLYHHNTDGTKDIILKTYLSENELTSKEAAESILKGEWIVYRTPNVHLIKIIHNNTRANSQRRL